MNNEELLKNMKRIKNNLENVKVNLRNAQNILNQSITFNNSGFKSDEINSINRRINTQLNNLNGKIIPKIKSM